MRTVPVWLVGVVFLLNLPLYNWTWSMRTKESLRTFKGAYLAHPVQVRPHR